MSLYGEQVSFLYKGMKMEESRRGVWMSMVAHRSLPEAKRQCRPRNGELRQARMVAQTLLGRWFKCAYSAGDRDQGQGISLLEGAPLAPILNNLAANALKI